MPSNDEVISLVLESLYAQGHYKTFDLFDFLSEKKIISNERDYGIYKDLIVDTGFAEMEMIYNEDLGTYESRTIELTDKGILVLKNHSSYESYLEEVYKQAKKQTKLERKERRKKALKDALENTSKIVAIILSISTVTLTILSISDRQERKSLEMDKQKLIHQYDSLKQEYDKVKHPT